MNYFIMKRAGTFAPSALNSPNQCKDQNTNLYDYECKILFDEHQQLDEHDFLIEHQLIDDLIQKLSLTGSCEVMAKYIVSSLVTFFKTQEIKISAIKMEILPYPRGKANISYFYLKDKTFAPLLNS